MQTITRRSLGLMLSACVTTACGSGTAPRTPSAAALARHIDSLYVAAVANVFITGDNALALRAYALSRIEVPLAFGVQPTPVALTIDSVGADFHVSTVSVTWQGVAYALIETSTGDTIVHLVAFSDYDATNVLDVSYVTGRNGGTSLAVSDTVQLGPFQSRTHASITSSSQPCDAPISVFNPLVGGLGSNPCHATTVQVTDSALAAVQFPPGVQAVRVVTPVLHAIGFTVERRTAPSNQRLPE
jgi:hypothetical protein